MNKLSLVGALVPIAFAFGPVHASDENPAPEQIKRLQAKCARGDQEACTEPEFPSH